VSISDYGRIVVVCTGNVARSPALAAVLQMRRADLDVSSAAVGRKAVAGLPMKRPMREILEREGYGDASPHRSRLLAELEWEPDLVVCCAPVHMGRVKEILPGVPSTLCSPVVPDPAFGGIEAYERSWGLIQAAADDILSCGVLTPGIDWSYGD
jgi:protein-tyrosine phosphatase